MWVRRVQAGRGAGAELLRGGERENGGAQKSSAGSTAGMYHGREILCVMQLRLFLLKVAAA